MTLPTPTACREYFATLLGVGMGPQQEHFLEPYLQFRFPPTQRIPVTAAPARNGAAFPLPSSGTTATPRPNWAAPTMTRLSRAEEQQQKEQREQQEILSKRMEQQNIQRGFSCTGGGRIYQKNRGEDELYSGKRGKTGQRPTASTSNSRSGTPVPPHDEPTAPPIATTSTSRSLPPAVKPTPAPFQSSSDVVTEAQFATSVKLELEEFDRSLVNFVEGEKGHRGCFCQGQSIRIAHRRTALTQ